MKFILIVCAGLLFAGFASPASAAQSLDPVIATSQSSVPNGPYYEQNGTATCAGSESSSSGSGPDALICRIDFAAPPPNRYLILEHVACTTDTSPNPLKDIALAIPAGANDARAFPLLPTLVAQSGGVTYYYTASQSVLYLAGGVARIVVHPTAESLIHMSCQISGHMNTVK